MELSKIEKLLEKYLDAETSIQEEQALSNYFTSGNVAPHLQEYESMFGYFQMSKAETSVKPIQLKTKKPIWRRLTIAASIALVCSLYFGNGYLEQRKAKEQYAQVKSALELLSSKLNEGNKAMSSSLYTYEDTVNKIFKTK
ncbi:hypothetical protein GCM10011416_15870 [Polaribacter pacificus]|uniref:Uncharacterized protein n=1 Tax=Polaribacter pacificus TaxID=1775173 RepID=A0A917HZT6_9FLAO|nr:hypothetical protein [Polaribacter pacificus]GGG98536.1 hypothetical protein GCM10011416_15870 [Polaribacter pacificus]